MGSFAGERQSHLPRLATYVDSKAVAPEFKEAIFKGAFTNDNTLVLVVAVAVRTSPFCILFVFCSFSNIVAVTTVCRKS